MYTMIFDITIGNFKLGMVERVTVHKSVELLADTATITLPGAEYNAALQIEDKLKRGDKVCIKFGYEETGLETEFEGWLQRITTDGGSITLTCEDDLYLYRKRLDNQVLQKCTLKELLEIVVRNAGQEHKVSCTYDWTYSKFVINNATGYDVLNILVLRNAFEKTRKQMKANVLSINALSDYSNFPMFAKLTLKKT